MPLTPPTAAEAVEYIARVRARLSQRNRLAAGVAVFTAPVPIVFALSGQPATGWPLAVALLSAPASLMLWHLRAGAHPQVVCPNCGDSWEYDAFLKSGVCEQCGLTLPKTAA